MRLALITIVLLVIAAGSAAPMAAEAAGTDAVAVSLEGRPLLEYRQTPNPNKVYVAKLFTPSGVQVLLDSPPDHVHHHGLMFALEVDQVSFWVDGAREGVQKPQGPAVVRTAPAFSLSATTSPSDAFSAATLAQTLDWTGADGRTRLVETRHIAAQHAKGPAATILTWNSRLAVPDGVAEARLETTRSYVGLGFRFPKSMDGQARFLFPDGKDSTPVRNTEKVTRDRWSACVGPVEGKTVTVAMFDHPGNPRHPACWFTMSDSLTYMTATLNLYRQPLTLSAQQPLDLCYGVAVWDGEVSRETIEALYQSWAGTKPAPANRKE